MTLQAALSAFNTEYYNSLTEKQKAEWLEILEKNIYKTIILCHEGGDKIKYIPFESVPSDKLELLVEDPFSDLYIKYLAMKRDLYFSDIEKYNNSSLLFRLALAEYKSYYTRTHKPVRITDHFNA